MKKQINKAKDAIKQNPIKAALIAIAAFFLGKSIYDKYKKK